MSTTIFNARVSFEPRSKKASNGEEFVLLNASKRAGKDSNGQPVYNEYHLTVWGRDVALARNLGVGDYITFTIEREQLEVWTGKDGKSRPYLSGNVREKLRQAQKATEDSPGYLPNVEALQAAQPKDLDASEIEVRLGATWVKPEYVQQFMGELFWFIN